MRDPRERLRDILEAIAAIQRYSGRGREAFDHDELVESWILRHLQIVGEAAHALPHDVRSLTRDIPWTQIIGMRHVLVHGYFAVDREIVWEAVEHGLPPLMNAVERLLAELTEQDDAADA